MAVLINRRRGAAVGRALRPWGTIRHGDTVVAHALRPRLGLLARLRVVLGRLDDILEAFLERIGN